jgi:hypothetical protein
MSANPMEILLARLLGDPAEVEVFLVDRIRYATELGFRPGTYQAVIAIDAEMLRFAARGYEHKRREHRYPR